MVQSHDVMVNGLVKHRCPSAQVGVPSACLNVVKLTTGTIGKQS